MGTLMKKVTPDYAYLWPKTLKSEIYNSGFLKKACQGCDISGNQVEFPKKYIE